MQLWQAISLGAAGGFVVEFVSLWGYLTSWQAARREHLKQHTAPLPRLGEYVDLPADALVAATRLLMGAGVGWLFFPQATGPLAAIAVGAAAPALLKQFQGARTLDGARHRAAVLGETAPQQQPLAAETGTVAP
ncbi:hypothetical protein ACIA98_26695 [Streptomyces sp. NPDC051366]|uniref:hypothetical protein n=1 Tax=Streptomyces sp. NPDC051366 TaxID=3365652 RepID=UPI00379784E2